MHGVAVDPTPTNQDLDSHSMTGNRLVKVVPILNIGFVPMQTGKESQHVMRLSFVPGQFAKS